MGSGFSASTTRRPDTVVIAGENATAARSPIVHNWSRAIICMDRSK